MRHTTLALLAALALAAAPVPLAAQAAAVPQIHPTDPHRLVKGGGVFFPLGFYGASITMATNDLQWNVIGPEVKPGNCPCDGNPDTSTCDPLPAEIAFEAFADKLAANGLNYFRAWINWGAIPVNPGPSDWDYHMVHPYRRSPTRGAVDGGNKFDLNQPNSCYYELLQREIDYAAGRGLVAQLALFDCWHVSQASHAERDYFKAQNNVNGVDWTSAANWLDPNGAVAPHQRAFVDQVMAAIGTRPNIVWETCNEDLTKTPGQLSHPATAISGWDQMIAAEVAAHDPLPHLVMPLGLPEHRTVAGHHTPNPNPPPGVDPSVTAMHNKLRDTQFPWYVPLITDNDCCPALGSYGSIPREKAWAALTAGAHTDFFVDNVAVTYALMNRTDVTTGMREIGYVGKFLRDLDGDLVGMAPADHLATGGTGTWAYARPGQEFVVYLRAAGTQHPQVTLASLPASFAAKWFNPRAGTNQTATGGPTFLAPASGDWVLHIKAVAPPLAICQQPTAQTVPSGGTATFQVAACGGTPPYSYRWQYSPTGTSFTNLTDGNGISGSMTGTLTINPVTSARVGYYRAKTTDAAMPPAQVTSNAARLDLLEPCTPNATTLCLQNDRFRVTATFVEGGITQVAKATPYSQMGGFFWFFGSTNLEVGVKIFPGPSSWWLFHGAASNLRYTLTVTDLQTGGPPKVYDRPAGGFCGDRDTNAFPLGSLAGAGGGASPAHADAARAQEDGAALAPCAPGPTTVCQHGNRFQVQVLRGGLPQPAVPLTAGTGLFWFFSQDNPEVFVKVIDGRTFNNSYWVFYGALSDRDYKVVVTDTATGAFKEYVNPLGTYCGSGDINAFPQ